MESNELPSLDGDLGFELERAMAPDVDVPTHLDESLSRPLELQLLTARALAGAPELEGLRLGGLPGGGDLPLVIARGVARPLELAPLIVGRAACGLDLPLLVGGGFAGPRDLLLRATQPRSQQSHLVLRVFRTHASESASSALWAITTSW